MLVFFLYSRSNLRNFDLGQLLEEIYLVTEGAADCQEGKWKTIQSLEKKKHVSLSGAPVLSFV